MTEMMEKLQVHLTTNEIFVLCEALLEYQLDRETISYFNQIREALQRGDTVSIQRNDNHG
jgi:hypothetical protein